MILVAAAHQGEEFVILLPIVLMGAAFFLLRWAASGPNENEDESAPAVAPPTLDIKPSDFALAGVGAPHETPVEPPEEAQAGDDPQSDHG